MAVTPPTTDINSWKYQDQYVERIMDNAAYTAAHPDDTLVLVGPPRKSMVLGDGSKNSLQAIGMLQAFQASQAKPIMPLQAIGSGRSFFVSGKSAVSFNIGRLFVKGKNLTRALYNNAVASGISLADFDEKVLEADNANYFVNLDSELFLIPFGMAVLFRDKSHNQLGGFYLELCMISNWAVGLNAGQNMLMENVTGMCDRLLPFHEGDKDQDAGVSSVIDEKIGFTAA